MDDASRTDDSEIVGVTDLDELARAFGLSAAASSRDGGDCERALTGSASAVQFEARRYANGAAFFAKHGTGLNSGHERPVLCVDLHTVNGTWSFSGVVLDAVTRYGIGAFVRTDTEGRDRVFRFERGAIHVAPAAEKARLASVSQRPFELPLTNATTVGGVLSRLTVEDVAIERPFVGVTREPLEIRPEVATAIHRFAWRDSEQSNGFSIRSDAVGRFDRRATVFGDGGAYGETVRFAQVDAHYLQQWLEAPRRMEETISVRSHGVVDPNRAPLAECTREATTRQYHCTGM